MSIAALQPEPFHLFTLFLWAHPHSTGQFSNKWENAVHITGHLRKDSCSFQPFKPKLSVLPHPSTLVFPGPTATIIGQNQCWVYNNNNWGEWVLREGIRGWEAGQAGLTTGSGEVIASKVVEVPAQATGGALVVLAHLQVDTRASIPGQREAKHTLHKQVISQSLNKHTAYSLRQT